MRRNNTVVTTIIHLVITVLLHFFKIRRGVYATRGKCRGKCRGNVPLYTVQSAWHQLLFWRIFRNYGVIFTVVVMLLFVCVSQFVSCCYTLLVGKHFYRLNEKIKFFHCSMKFFVSDIRYPCERISAQGAAAAHSTPAPGLIFVIVFITNS
jgi:hypothetical protein